MGRVLRIGRPYGVYRPDYRISMWHNGDPRRPIGADQVNLRMISAIQTSKNLTDLSGTFSIVCKDRRVKRRVREMDVVRIQLSGHENQQLTTVMRGVVDNVRAVGSGDPYGAREDTIVEGRCMGKYLQVSSLFLPVWDPDGNLPTALTFGLGDVTKKGTPTYGAGGLGPFNIFRYLVRNYLYGGKGTVGTSGIPASRHWVDYRSRFSRKLGFEIPFLQFDEDSLAMALQQMQIPGFTEAWMDEIGRVVYRKPQWDSPARYSISTDALQDWDFPRGDVETATYCEVIPSGDPGIDSSIAQALRAGRAPVPSSYVRRRSGKRTGLGKYVSDEFIIDTDRDGKPTAKGTENPWWRLQQRLGIRPQQISSPLLVTQEQAQAQAEGLLRFYSRYTKAISVTIPGEAGIRLGYTARVHGHLEGHAFDRSGYVEQVSHQYVENDQGGSYSTSLTCTHGRDARDPFTGKPDPKWGAIALPKFDPQELAQSSGSGTIESGDGVSGGGGKPASVGWPLGRRGQTIGTPGVGTHSFSAAPNNWESDNAVDIGVPKGTPVFAVADGTIGPSFGLLPGGNNQGVGAFAGLRLHLVTAGNEWYYAHLSAFAPGIKPGVHVKKGQRLGSSGVANGVSHLHLACEHGNPKTILGA